MKWRFSYTAFFIGSRAFRLWKQSNPGNKGSKLKTWEGHQDVGRIFDAVLTKLVEYMY